MSRHPLKSRGELAFSPQLARSAVEIAFSAYFDCFSFLFEGTDEVKSVFPRQFGTIPARYNNPGPLRQK